MSALWTDNFGGAGTTATDVAAPHQMVQLDPTVGSEGPILIYLRRIGATIELRPNDYSNTPIATIATGTTTSTFSTDTNVSFGLCRDNTNALYLAGPAGDTGTAQFRVQGFVKAGFYSWTAQTAQSYNATTDTLGPLPKGLGHTWMHWCNTGSGPFSKGHLAIAFDTPSSGAPVIQKITAGDPWGGTHASTGNLGTVVVSNGVITGKQVFMSPDGFGSTNFLCVGRAASTANILFTLAVSGGAYTVTLHPGTAPASNASGDYAPVPVRVASNVWAVISNDVLTANAGRFSVGRYSFTAQLTAPTTKVVNNNVALTRTNGRFMFGVAKNLNTGKVYIFYKDSTTGTTLQSIGVDCGSGVTWDAASAVWDTAVGANTDFVAMMLLDSATNNNAQDMLWQNTSGHWIDKPIQFNTVPNAPTLTAPANASVQDLGAGFTFTWTFSDPDAGDTQSSFALRRKISGAGSYEWWNGVGWQGSEIFVAGVPGSITFAASKWTNGNVYNWSVATKDAGGLQGPYSGDFTVTASAAPTATATAPSGTVTNTSRPLVMWSVSDPEGDPQQTYQIKVESGSYGATPGAGTAVWDSTETADPASRSKIVGVDLANGTTYRFFVRVKTNGQYSAWSFATATMSLDAPAVPTLAVAFDAANARVALTLQGRDNQLSQNDSDFETSVAGWTGTNAALSRITAQFAHGVASMQLQSAAAGAFSASLPVGLAGSPVLGGLQYTALASFRRISATADRNAMVSIRWYTAAGAFISQSDGATVLDNNAGWTAAFVTANAPANAAFAAVVVTVNGATAANEQHAVDMIDLGPGSSATWTRGGLLGLTKIVVEYQDAAGLWLPVRNSPFSVDANQQAVAYDYEAPPNVARVYRAKAQAEV